MSDSILVAIRFRPLIAREKANKQKEQWTIQNANVFQIDNLGRRTGEPYGFDHIFEPTQTNNEIYTVVQPMVISALEGFHSTIFAYGQTSSGKTHTMLGSGNKEPGIMKLAINNIFEKVCSNSHRRFLIRVSYIEIYNERINDLLDTANEDIKIREDLSGIYYKCKEEVVSNAEEVFEVMHLGNKVRKIGNTEMNERSSRSHTIFRMIIESTEKDAVEGAMQISQLNFVDLAGSERVAQTKAEGVRLKEGVHINKSLSTLSLVIKQLSDSERFINFRDSKLTRLLQNALGGNSKTLIIANVTAASIDETISTLSFAQRAKVIKNKPIINETVSDQENAKRYEHLSQIYKKQLDNELKKILSLQTEREEDSRVIKFLENKVKTIETFQNLHTPIDEVHPKRRHTICIPKPLPSKVPVRISSLSDVQSTTPRPFLRKCSLGDPPRVLESVTESEMEDDTATRSVTPTDPFREPCIPTTPHCVLKKRLTLLDESYEKLRNYTQLESTVGIKDENELVELKSRMYEFIELIESQKAHLQKSELELEEKSKLILEYDEQMLDVTEKLEQEEQKRINLESQLSEYLASEANIKSLIDEERRMNDEVTQDAKQRFDELVEQHEILNKNYLAEIKKVAFQEKSIETFKAANEKLVKEKDSLLRDLEEMLKVKSSKVKRDDGPTKELMEKCEAVELEKQTLQENFDKSVADLSKLVEENEKLRVELIEVKTSLSILKTVEEANGRNLLEIEELRQTVKKLEDTNCDEVVEKQKLQEMLNALTGEKDGLLSLLELATDSQIKLNQEKETLIEINVSLDKTISAQNSEIKDLNDALTKWKESTEKLSLELEALSKDKHEDKIVSEANPSQEFDEERKSLNDTIERHLKTIEWLQEEVVENEIQADLNKHINAQFTAIKDVHEDIVKKYNADKKLFARTVDEHLQSIQVLEREIKIISAEKFTLNAQLEDYKSQIESQTSLLNTIKGLQDEIEQLIEDNNKCKKNEDETNAKHLSTIEGLERDLNELYSENDRLTDELSKSYDARLHEVDILTKEAEKNQAEQSIVVRNLEEKVRVLLNKTSTLIAQVQNTDVKVMVEQNAELLISVGKLQENADQLKFKNEKWASSNEELNKLKDGELEAVNKAVAIHLETIQDLINKNEEANQEQVKTIEELREEVIKAKAEEAKLSSTIEQHLKSIGILEDEQRKLKAEIEDCKVNPEVENISATNACLLNTIETLEENIMQLKHENAKLLSQIDELVRCKGEEEGTLNKTIDAHLETIENQKEQLINLEQENQKLTKDMENLAQTITEQSEKIECLERKIEANNAEKIKLNEQIEESLKSKNELINLQQLHADLEEVLNVEVEAKTKMQEDYNSLLEEKKSHIIEITDLQESVQNLQATNEELKVELEKVSNQQEDYNNLLQTYNAAIENNNTLSEEYKTYCATKEKEKLEMEEMNSDLKKTIKNLESQLSEVEKTSRSCDVLNNKIENLKKQAGQLNKQYEKSLESNMQLDSELKKLRTEMANVTEEHSSLKTKYEKLDNEFQNNINKADNLNEAEKLREEIVQLEGKISELSIDKIKLQRVNKQQEIEIGGWKTKCRKLEDKSTELNKEIKALKISNRDCEQNKMHLDRDFGVMKEELRRLKENRNGTELKATLSKEKLQTERRRLSRQSIHDERRSIGPDCMKEQCDDCLKLEQKISQLKLDVDKAIEAKTSYKQKMEIQERNLKAKDQLIEIIKGKAKEAADCTECHAHLAKNLQLEQQIKALQEQTQKGNKIEILKSQECLTLENKISHLVLDLEKVNHENESFKMKIESQERNLRSNEQIIYSLKGKSKEIDQKPKMKETDCSRCTRVADDNKKLEEQISLLQLRLHEKELNEHKDRKQIRTLEDNLHQYNLEKEENLKNPHKCDATTALAALTDKYEKTKMIARYRKNENLVLRDKLGIAPDTAIL